MSNLHCPLVGQVTAAKQNHTQKVGQFSGH